MEKDEIRALLGERLPFWGELCEGDRRLLTETAVCTVFPKGAAVHNAETDCIGVLLLLTGTLCVYLLSDEGREITVYKVSAGETCVLSASCVIRQITFDVHINAEEECRAVVLSAGAYSQVIGRSVHAECYTYKLATECFSCFMHTMQSLLFDSFEKRLAACLAAESARQGSLTLAITHEQLAKHTGSAREVVSRTLKKLCEQGIITQGRGRLILTDLDKLDTIIGQS